MPTISRKSVRSLRTAILRGRWYHKSFEGTPFALYQWQDSPVVSKQGLLRGLPPVKHRALTIAQGGHIDWYWDQADLDRLWRWWEINLTRQPLFGMRVVNRWRQVIQPWVRMLREFDRLDLSRLSDAQLITRFATFYQSYLPSTSIAALNEGFSLVAERALGGRFLAWLQRRGQADQFVEFFAALTQSSRPSFSQEMARAARHGVSPKALAARYYWVHFNYLHTQRLTATYFKKRHATKIPDFHAVISRKRRLTRELDLPVALQRLFQAADLFTWWQDQRKKYALIATEWLYRFLREAGRRRRLPWEALTRSIPSEFPSLVGGDEKYLRQLQARRDPVLVYAHAAEGTMIISGQPAAEIFKTMNAPSTQQEVRGTPTHVGHARGRVIVLHGLKDMRRVRPGNVIVTSMTRPEFTPILSRAAAIVTDEGGITSHAAVVSREFGIPCVIGTKIATKVFKNGDRVEVDATKGIVRKLP